MAGPDKDKMSREEAGQKGGEATLREHGPEFYSEIGTQQGQENNPGNFANDQERAAEAGSESGKRRSQDDD